MGQKNPNTCSCGMDAQACSYEKQKRSSLKLKNETKKALAKMGSNSPDSEEMVTMVDEEGTVHRPLRQVKAAADRQWGQDDGFDGGNSESAAKKEDQEWTVV